MTELISQPKHYSLKDRVALPPRPPISMLKLRVSIARLRGHILGNNFATFNNPILNIEIGGRGAYRGMINICVCYFALCNLAGDVGVAKLSPSPV